MSRKSENTGFLCVYCGREVLPLSNGSFRNHCPFCLHSKHVDIFPGDRMSKCGGILKPIGIKIHKKKGMQIIHICEKCGTKRVNIIAEDNKQSDDINELVKLKII
ncbi:RNHCP domain-containing protein [Sporosalibacterium faouarense]|uniref:RNHCP domain-containing protein n=1 Tax=Sporosalibacterium faouarense TaxID=516123 RepID=UPI00192CA291|nr:RNHCP domain-containing protein [Sporosalibacterium faouarense]